MPYTVMLVDNEAIIPRGLMCLIDWKAHNCCVRAIANDGVDAVHQIQESPPDILITDIRTATLRLGPGTLSGHSDDFAYRLSGL